MELFGGASFKLDRDVRREGVGVEPRRRRCCEVDEVHDAAVSCAVGGCFDEGLIHQTASAKRFVLKPDWPAQGARLVPLVRVCGFKAW